LRVPVLLWARLLIELRRRGMRRRESGAFLLVRKNVPLARVTSFICYDELDPEALATGAITFHAVGYAALWAHCRHHDVDVVGDIHTHPGNDVRQSSIDRRNPMIPIVGHLALIVPNFAHTPWWSLREAGVYEYDGNFMWHRAQARLRLSLW